MNAIITGATKGIGRAITFSLAEAGYDLAICARNQQQLDDLTVAIQTQYPHIKVLAVKANFADKADVERFAMLVEQHFVSPDVLINNTGTFIPGSVFDEAADDAAFQFQINYFSADYLCRFFGAKMKNAGKGHIINICSIAALNAISQAATYSVTKAALLTLTHILRKELMQHQVKVTAIHPGSTLTSSWEGTTIPKERFVAADDIAKAVMYCLSCSVGANPDELVVTPLLGNI